MELSKWVEQRGAADVADNVRGALDTIDKMKSSSSCPVAVMMRQE
jgi:hypothetical protein